MWHSKYGVKLNCLKSNLAFYCFCMPTNQQRLLTQVKNSTTPRGSSFLTVQLGRLPQQSLKVCPTTTHFHVHQQCSTPKLASVRFLHLSSRLSCEQPEAKHTVSSAQRKEQVKLRKEVKAKIRLERQKKVIIIRWCHRALKFKTAEITCLSMYVLLWLNYIDLPCFHATYTVALEASVIVVHTSLVPRRQNCTKHPSQGYIHRCPGHSPLS